MTTTSDSTYADIPVRYTSSVETLVRACGGTDFYFDRSVWSPGTVLCVRFEKSNTGPGPIWVEFEVPNERFFSWSADTLRSLIVRLKLQC